MMAVAAVAVIILGLAAYFLAKSSKAPIETSTTKAVPTQGSAANAFTSIKDALMKSLSLQCDFTDSAKGVKTVAYIKNGMVRSDFTGKTAQTSGSVIIKDGKVYFWNSSSAIVMAMPSVTVTPGAQAGASQGQNMMNSLEQYKQYCHVASVDDSVFNLPTGVKFQDLTTTQSGSKTGPSAADQARIQEIMKKYNNPQVTVPVAPQQ